MTADPFSRTAKVRTHAMPCHSGLDWAARKISLLATVMASRMRCSVVPVSRSRRPRTRSSAMAAACSPAACPPMPSTTRKMPRSGSMCQASSLLRRTRPGSLPLAQFTLALTMRCASEIQVEHFGEADTRPFRNRHLHVAVAFLSVYIFDARGRLFAVDGGAEAAEVLQEKLAAQRVAPEAEMFPRNIRQGVELEVGPIVTAPAAHHDLLLGHLVRLVVVTLPVLDHGISARFDARSHGQRRNRRGYAGAGGVCPDGCTAGGHPGGGDVG